MLIMFYWLKTIFVIQFAIVVSLFATTGHHHVFQKNNQVIVQSNNIEMNQWKTQDSTTSKPYSSSIPFSLLVGLHLDDDDLNDHGKEDCFDKDMTDFQNIYFSKRNNSKELNSNYEKNHEEPLLLIEFPPPEFYRRA